MKSGKEGNRLINFLEKVNGEKGKYPLSKRERMDSRGQVKGLVLNCYMDNSSTFTGLKTK